MTDYYIWVILLINQSEEIGEKQHSIFGSIGGGGGGVGPLMHVAQLAILWEAIYVGCITLTAYENT